MAGSHRETKTMRVIRKLLIQTGLPHSLEYRSKHIAIVLDGTVIGVMSHGGNEGSSSGKNIISKIMQRCPK